MKLPETLRPRGSRYRHFQPGLDLPSSFQDDLKGMDRKLYLVWHPYRVIWDNIINQYEGELEDPRFTIHETYNELVFGFVLTDGQGCPIPENEWHIWRLNDPYGWEHIIRLRYNEPEYLDAVLRNLYRQSIWFTKYGALSYNKLMRTLDEEKREKAIEDHASMMDAWQEENAWLVKKAAENLDRGVINPTNPQKETIISGPGIKHRSRIITPLEDEQGGLVTLD